MDQYVTRVRLVIDGKPVETIPLTWEQLDDYLANFRDEKLRSKHGISELRWLADGKWIGAAQLG